MCDGLNLAGSERTANERASMRLIVQALAITVALAAPAAAQGVLKMAVGSNLATLDPARSTNGEEYIYDNLVFNGLTRMRADLVVEPELAERWEYSQDLKTWTFHLRRGVKFHHGREMVADDVIK